MCIHRYEHNCYIHLPTNYNLSWSPWNFLVGPKVLFPRAYTKLFETELYGSNVGQFHHRLMSHRRMANPQTLIEASTNCPWTWTGYWQEKTFLSEELLIMSEWLLLYVALCAISQYDILCQYLDRRNGGYHFKQYCTLHFFQKVDVDVTHNHDDKYPALSESEIDQYLSFDSQPTFCPEEKWCLKVDVNE